MKKVMLCLLLALMLAGCTRNNPNAGSPSAIGSSAGTRWLSSDLKEVGMNKQPLDRMLQDVLREDIKSIYILKNGKPVLEYHKEKEQLYYVYSCTKSIMSACLGIALEQGAIESIDQPLSDFFPELLEEGVDPLKRAITLRHLLNMTSGIDWPEWTTWNYRTGPMRDSEDWVKYVLSRPMAQTPGQRFNYCSGGSHLLAVIIQKQTGMPLLDFARQHLFDPLGIGEVEWFQDPQDYYYGGAGISMATSDMAKLGQLYLQLGKWEDQQIVPEAWVRESTAWQSAGESFIGTGYGLQWWLTSLERASTKHDIYFAMGYAGQFIYVVPELELVVAFTGWSPDNPLRPEHFLRTYIIPAVAR